MAENDSKFLADSCLKFSWEEEEKGKRKIKKRGRGREEEAYTVPSPRSCLGSSEAAPRRYFRIYPWLLGACGGASGRRSQLAGRGYESV